MRVGPNFDKRTALRFGRFFVDVAIAVSAFYLSYFIITASRGIDWVPGLADKTFAFAVISSVFLIIFSVDRGTWRHVSIPDLLIVIKASLASVVAFMLASFLVSRGSNVPRSVPLLTFVFMMSGMAGVRLAYRLAVEGSWLEAIGVRSDLGRKKVLLYGFTDQAEGYIRMVRRMPRRNVSVVGILDDEHIYRTRSVQGVQVLGSLDDLDRVLERQKSVRNPIEEIIVTERAPTRQKLSELVELATSRALKISRIPDLTETASISSTHLFEPKPLELGDLLGRPEVKADMVSKDWPYDNHKRKTTHEVLL